MHAPVENGKIVPVILCGGAGRRLWPASQEATPKPFLALGNPPGNTFLAETLARLQGMPWLEMPIALAAEAHRFQVAEHLREAGFSEAKMMLEPVARNTAPAIMAAALAVRKRYGDDALLLVLPSDHIIRDKAAFARSVAAAARTAQHGHLVTFGITPESAETGYGYIHRGTPLEHGNAWRVERFVEKPDKATAEHYLASGEYLWNSGMFMFPVAVLLEEIQAHCPDIAGSAELALAMAEHDRDFTWLEKEAFASCPAVSIDYALMERTSRGAVVPLCCGWSDAGSWDALWHVADKDSGANVLQGDVSAYDVRGSYLQQHGGAAITALGVEGLVVVSTPNRVLVIDRRRSQEVGRLMKTPEEDAAGAA